MKIFLTGGTGYLGSAVLNLLVRSGHTVAALARSDASVREIGAAGASAVRGELTSRDVLVRAVKAAEGVIHTASPGDATTADTETAFLDAVLPVLAGSGKPYIHTAGTWVHGSGDGLSEETPFRPPPLVAWRPAVINRVRAAAQDDIHSVVISPANVYGYGKGIPSLIMRGPQTKGAESALLYPGLDQHFSNVYIEDVAALYLLALTGAAPGAYYLGANGESPSMRELAAAASTALGLAGHVQAEAEDATRGRLGPLTDALLLDQQVNNQHVQSLGWTPTGPLLLDELRTGSYADLVAFVAKG